MPGNGYSNINIVGLDGFQGTSPVNPFPTATAAATVQRINALATTNLTSAAVGARTVTGFVLVNTTAAFKFVKLYDKASAPVLATDVPLVTLAVPPNGTLVSDASFAIALGLAYAITNLVADTDATAVTADAVHGFIAHR